MSRPEAKRKVKEESGTPLDAGDLIKALQASLHARAERIQEEEEQLEIERVALALELDERLQRMRKGQVKDWAGTIPHPEELPAHLKAEYTDVLARHLKIAAHEQALGRERATFKGELRRVAQTVQQMALRRTERVRASVDAASVKPGVKAEDDAAPPPKRAKLGDHSTRSEFKSEPDSKPVAEMESGAAMKMFKCSECNWSAFRDVVLKRCNHTFCRSCLDSRLANRQRKCPACDEPFSTSDMQNIVFQ
ncbi:hypothetical protein C8R46DRAFT_1209076 [Mycena filopes]|nr:hypothetical protein C8R46DRAFT_1209076 [Mycena filopes]